MVEIRTSDSEVNSHILQKPANTAFTELLELLDCNWMWPKNKTSLMLLLALGKFKDARKNQQN